MRHFIQGRPSTVSNGGWFFEQLFEMETLQEIISVDEATFFPPSMGTMLFVLHWKFVNKAEVIFFFSSWNVNLVQQTKFQHHGYSLKKVLCLFKPLMKFRNTLKARVKAGTKSLILKGARSSLITGPSTPVLIKLASWGKRIQLIYSVECEGLMP